jgi:hypothetical protein
MRPKVNFWIGWTVAVSMIVAILLMMQSLSAE